MININVSTAFYVPQAVAILSYSIYSVSDSKNRIDNSILAIANGTKQKIHGNGISDLQFDHVTNQWQLSYSSMFEFCSVSDCRNRIAKETWLPLQISSKIKRVFAPTSLAKCWLIGASFPHYWVSDIWKLIYVFTYIPK